MGIVISLGLFFLGLMTFSVIKPISELLGWIAHGSYIAFLILSLSWIGFILLALLSLQQRQILFVLTD